MHTPVNPIQINVNQLQRLVVVTEKYNHTMFETDLHATHVT